MIFHEEFMLKVPHREAWEFFTDFPGPITVIPGLISLREQGPEHYVGIAQIRLGPFNCRFEGEVKIKSIDSENHRVVLEGGARDQLIGAHFDGIAYAQTVAQGANQSRVLLEVQVGLGGTLGVLGKLILKPRARSIVEHYRQLCERELERRRVARSAPSSSLINSDPKLV